MKPGVWIDGERWNKYSADFRYNDKTYAFDFFARNPAEAEEMLRAIRTTAVECHEIHGEISANVPGSGLFVRAICAARNLFS
jgi:hypothetical protein